MTEEDNIIEKDEINETLLPEDAAGSFVVIIPAYNPGEVMIEFITKLFCAGFKNIVIIDDGSKEESRGVISDAESFGCRVVRHAVNLGKGRSLKDALNYIALYMSECKYGMVLDCEGNQNIPSINKLARALLKNPDSLVLGCRNYRSKNTKFGKRITNILTKAVMTLLCGVTVADTKTTIRAFSMETAMKFINTGGERYDYEVNVLLESKSKEVKITEVTLGDENFTNKESHYNPLIDSFNLYKLFLRYLLVAVITYGVDLGLFRLLMAYLKIISPIYYTIIDTVLARIVSSFVGLVIKRKRVFKTKEHTAATAAKYYTAIFGQMIVSALAVWSLQKVWPVDVVVIKLIVDFVLFIIGFIAQREWVFKTREKKREEKVSKDRNHIDKKKKKM